MWSLVSGPTTPPSSRFLLVSLAWSSQGPFLPSSCHLHVQVPRAMLLLPSPSILSHNFKSYLYIDDWHVYLRGLERGPDYMSSCIPDGPALMPDKSLECIISEGWLSSSLTPDHSLPLATSTPSTSLSHFLHLGKDYLQLPGRSN